jgi:phage anti-repressor protein
MKIEDAIPIFVDKMNDLPVDVIRLRDLYNWLNIGSKYNDWIIRRFERYQFAENLDYIKDYRNVRLAPNYHATIDMAEKLCMVETSERSKIAYDHFRWKRITIQKKLIAESERVHAN